jgi:isoamylase
MIVAGDEMGRTQQGNNNAYCQDTTISWIDWNLSPEQESLLLFVRLLVHFRQAHPVLRRRTFFQGHRVNEERVSDIAWLEASGSEMSDASWTAPQLRSVGVLLAGDAIAEVTDRGEPVRDDTLLVLLNAGDTPAPFALPAPENGRWWQVEFDTAQQHLPIMPVAPGTTYPLAGRSVVVLRFF